MALTPVTTTTIIARNFAGLFGKVLGTASMAIELSKAGTTTESVDAYLNTLYVNSFDGRTSDYVADIILENTGIATADPELVAIAKDYIVWILDTDESYNGGNTHLGAAIDGILNDLRNLAESPDPAVNSIAIAWNTTVNNSESYSIIAGNVDTTITDLAVQPGGDGNEAGKNYVLTTTQDVLTGSAGDDFFRGVAGAAIGAQDQTTLNSSDIIDGADGNDTLIVNMTGPTYNGGARIKNVETLQIGTNQAASTFDYNVNAGSNEVTEVTKIVYDQINNGEILTVQNILTTTIPAVAETTARATSATNIIPTLAWVNEAGSEAGTIVANFRESAVDGATDLNIELHNVKALVGTPATGRLDIGGGVETFTITSGGTTTNTLHNSRNLDGLLAADLVSASADGVNDNGALTKVIIKGSQALGTAPGVITNDETGEANYGLTNRAANGANDLGISNTRTSASNLLSVAGTVTEVDATENTGGVAVRFVGKNNVAVATNVTFKGSTGNDYAEFQLGNVNATGGDGNDTFAFVNTVLTNYDFGSADSIVGGAGTDTIQFGLNGAGTITANTTEFNNKTGIDVLDLRGATNTVTLSDAFVAGADAGLTVRTDKIVQTSETSNANTTPSLATNNRGLEDASVNTVVLTQLADNRTIEFVGGSGSDRIVVNNATANQFTKLDGGSNVGSATTGLLGSNDSLTVVNTAVLDANDVANIKGFELLNLVESTIANNTFNVSISEAFLLANSTSAVNLTIASVTNTYGTRLGAGDVVNLEISDLLVGGAAKPTILGRVVNIQDLIAAGTTVNFQQNGVTVSTNAAPAALAANVNIATAPAATLLDDVPGAVPAPAAITLTAGATFTGTAGVNDTFSGTYASLNGTTITGTAADRETLTMTDAVAAAIGGGGAAGTITNIDVLNLANVANTAVSFGAGTGISTVNGGTANDTIAVSDATLNAFGGVVGAPLGSINGGAGVDTLSVFGAFDVTDDSVINFESLNFNAANNLLTVGANALLNQFSIITFAGNGDITVAAGTHSIADAIVTNNGNAADDTVITVAAGASLTVGGNAQLTAADVAYQGAGTIVSNGPITFDAATDSFTGTITLAANAAANFTDAALSPNNTFTVNTLDATTAKAVTLEAADGVANTIQLDATGTATASVAITNFAVANDIVSLNTNGIGTNDAIFAAVGGNISAANGNTVSTIANLYVVDDGAVALATANFAAVGNGAAVEAAILTAALDVGVSGSSGNVYVVLGNGTDSAIYRLAYTEGADAGAVLNDANDFSVTLVGTVAVDVSTLTTANFA